MFYKGHVGIILSLLSVLLFSSGGAVHAQEFHFINYNVEEGLAQSQVFDICQDHNGFLWIATNGGGISRFDGTNFKTFNAYDGLYDNEIRAIIEDQQHRLWIGHRFGGLTMYDGRDFKTYSKAEGLDFEGLTGMVEDGAGHIWMATENAGIYEFDGTQFIPHGSGQGLPTDSFLSVALSPEKMVYARTTLGIVRFSDDSYEALPPLPEPKLRGNALTFGRDGQLYFNVGRNIYRFEDGRYILHLSLPGSGTVFDLNFDSKDRLWISTSTGLIRVFKDEILTFDHQDNWYKATFYMTMEDQSGNIWLGTEGGGVSKFTGDRFVHFGTNTPIERTAVFSIDEIEPGLMWVGTVEGLYEFKNMQIRRIENFPVAQPWINDVEVLADEQILISAKQGVFIYDGANFEAVLDEAGGTVPDPHSISQDSLGHVWVGAKNGVWMVRNGTAYHIKYDQPALQGVVRHVMEDSHGARWYLTEKRGIFRYADGRLEQVDAEIERNARAFEMMEDKNGNMWISTLQGLICYRDGGVHTLSTQDGLSANIIYILVQDEEGNIWVGTEKGINRIQIDENSRPTHIRTYGSKDGFIGVECNATAGLLDSQGNLWFGTILGMTCYAPEKDVVNAIPPQIQIHSVQIQMKDVDWEVRGDSITPWNHLPVNPRLRGHENNLRFEFSGVTMVEPEKVRYQYKLEPEDEEWVSTSETNSATYSGLDYGSYTFKVRACNSDSVWNPVPATFSFSIPTPTIETWWFRFAVLAGIFFLVYSLVRLRINSLNRSAIQLQEKIRERTEELETANEVKSEFLAKMSHEIRTPMNGVIGMTDLLRRTELNDRQQKFVKNIRISGENLLSLINDILDFSRIESGKLDLENVPLEIRQLIEEVLDILAYGAYEKGLELMYQVDPEIRGPIFGDPSRLKQILVNLVGNAIKFTDKGRVAVYAKLIAKDGEEARIQISVKDSGIGIPKEKFAALFDSFTQVDASTTRKYGGTGLGLAISYTLAQKMGGKMWVESEAGKGAEFFFTIRGGMSAPWKYLGKDHPAHELVGQTVAIAIADPEAQNILERYLAHWEMKVVDYHSLESISDALLEGVHMDFLLVDTRLFTEHHLKATERFAATCAEHKMHFGLLCEPEQAIAIEASPNAYGWLLSKPFKRDDLLNALRHKRVRSRSAIGQAAAESTMSGEYPLRILVAEDNPINMDVARGMLGNLGYTPDEAENGVEVLALLKEKTYDVVLMDVQMPEMDGLETTRRIISEYARNVRPLIVAMTANAMESDRKRCLEAGMDTFISKPFVMDELIGLIRNIRTGAPEGVYLEDQSFALVEEAAAKNSQEEAEAKEEAPTQDDPTPAVEEAASESTPPSAETNGQTALTDLGMLQEASGGDSAFISGVLGKLVVKLPEAVKELQEAAAAQDWETVRATSHRTKSSAAYSGATELKEKFRLLEHMAREQEDLDQVPDKLAELEDYVSKVVEELKGHLATM